jgi:hypothetical protein
MWDGSEASEDDNEDDRMLPWRLCGTNAPQFCRPHDT